MAELYRLLVRQDGKSLHCFRSSLVSLSDTLSFSVRRHLVNYISKSFIFRCYYNGCLNVYFQPWLVWLSGLSTGLRTKGSPVRFPGGAHVWVVGQAPSRGHTRGSHTLMFPSLSSSFSSL